MEGGAEEGKEEHAGEACKSPAWHCSQHALANKAGGATWEMQLRVSSGLAMMALLTSLRRRVCPRSRREPLTWEGCGEEVNVTWSNLLFQRITLVTEGDQHGRSGQVAGYCNSTGRRLWQPGITCWR